MGDRQLARVLSRHTCMAYRDDGTDRETAEGAGFRKQLGQDNPGNEWSG